MSEPQPRKPFSDSRLVVLGDTRDLTQPAGKIGARAAGGNGNMVEIR